MGILRHWPDTGFVVLLGSRSTWLLLLVVKEHGGSEMTTSFSSEFAGSGDGDFFALVSCRPLPATFHSGVITMSCCSSYSSS